MKTNTIIMTALLAATVAAPAFAAANMQDKAVQAAADKTVSVREVEPYVAAAARQKSATAPELLTAVLSQRSSWTTEEVRDLYSAVLEGANLRRSFSQNLRDYVNGRNQQDLGVRLLSALKTACGSMPSNTFDSVVALLVNDANGTAAEGIPQSVPQDPHVYTICDTDPRDSRPNPVPVTPDPISPQN